MLPGPWSFLGMWVVGGAFALVGAICYAELAAAMPADGGDYVFLSRAYGRPVGFLFGWSQFWVVRPGSIGALAFIHANYAQRIVSLGEHGLAAHAALAIAALSIVNLFGISAGKWTQNLLTIAKGLGLFALIAIGLIFRAPDEGATPAALDLEVDWGQALVFILFVYGGWNDMAYVSAEVRDPDRNILRALLWGTATVVAIYLATNVACLCSLGFEGTRRSEAIATEIAELGLGASGATLVAALVCISALGAVHGMLFTGARVYFALGSEQRWFAPLGKWNARRGVPTIAVLAQGVVTLGAVLTFGLGEADGFERMVRFTLPVFWGFLATVAWSLIRLRRREPNLPRPFRVPWHPVTPLIFVAGSLYMLFASLRYAFENRSIEALWALGLVALGVLFTILDRNRESSAHSKPTG